MFKYLRFLQYFKLGFNVESLFLKITNYYRFSRLDIESGKLYN